MASPKEEAILARVDEGLSTIGGQSLVDAQAVANILLDIRQLVGTTKRGF